jgi:DNA-binding transcriptional MerR regulator
MDRPARVVASKEQDMSIEAMKQALDPRSLAGILLRDHDNLEQAIRYAERMAQRYANSRSLMAIEYQDALQELKAWKQNKSL